MIILGTWTLAVIARILVQGLAFGVSGLGAFTLGFRVSLKPPTLICFPQNDHWVWDWLL